MGENSNNSIIRGYRNGIIKNTLNLLLYGALFILPFATHLSHTQIQLYQVFTLLIIIGSFSYYKIIFLKKDMLIRRFNKNNQRKSETKERISYNKIIKILSNSVFCLAVVLLILMGISILLNVDLLKYEYVQITVEVIFLLFIVENIIHLVNSTYNFLLWKNTIFELFQFTRPIKDKLIAIERKISKISINPLTAAIVSIMCLMLIGITYTLLGCPSQTTPEGADLIRTLLTANTTTFTLLFTLSIAILSVSKYSKSRILYSGYNLIYMMLILFTIFLQIMYLYNPIQGQLIVKILTLATVFIFSLLIPYFIGLNYSVSPRKIVDSIRDDLYQEIYNKKLYFGKTTKSELKWSKSSGASMSSHIEIKGKRFEELVTRIYQLAIISWRDQDTITFRHVVKRILEINRKIIEMHEDKYLNANFALMEIISKIAITISKDNIFSESLFDEIRNSFLFDTALFEHPKNVINLDKVRPLLFKRTPLTKDEIVPYVDSLLFIVLHRYFHGHNDTRSYKKNDKVLEMKDYLRNYEKSPYSDVLISLGKKHKFIKKNLEEIKKTYKSNVSTNEFKHYKKIIDFLIKQCK